MKKTLKLFFILTCFFFLVPRIIHESSAELNILPRLSQSEGFNDNILYTNKEKKEDFSSIISPSLEIGLKSKGSDIAMNYKGGIEKYHNYTGFNNITHTADLVSKTRILSTLFLTVEDDFNISEGANIMEDEQGLRSSLLRERQKRTYNNSRLELLQEWGKRFSLSLGYRNYYEDVEVNYEVDENHHTIDGGLVYLISKGGRDILNLNFSNTSYAFKENNENFRFQRDFDTNMLTLEYTHRFNNRFDISTYGGANMNDYKNPEIKDDILYVMGGNLRKDFNKIGLGLGYNRRINSGGGLGGGVLEQRYEINLNSEVSAKGGLFLKGSYLLNDFLGSRVFYFRDNRYWQFRIRFNYNISYWWNIETRHLYSMNNYQAETRSNFSDYNYYQGEILFNFPLNKILAVNLNYRYIARDLQDKEIDIPSINNQEYINNTIMFSITYSPFKK